MVEQSAASGAGASGGAARPVVPPADGGRTFIQVLINTAVANVTSSYLWWALTFWAYLETRSVLATGIIGGVYMLLIALLSMVFGSIVDRYRKHHAMIVASLTTFISFSAAGVLYLLLPEESLSDLSGPWFWLFAGIILFGGVIENMRNIALSTTVTLLIPVERHANANGLVGTVTGLVFLVTSVFSGLSIGLLGMGWTILIAIVFTGLVLLHLLFLTIPEEKPVIDERRPIVDVRGGIHAVRQVPGLFALIIFTTFNNLIGGTYMALMDPYGIDMFGVELWGIVFAFASTGFIIGGLVVAKFGLGKNPIRTMLFAVAFMGLLGALFTVREWWPLYALGIWLYMAIFPLIEAAEQTTIQKVVPFRTQGRVFGFAQAFESAAAPITSFAIAPIAEFVIIPYMESADGQNVWGWLLGEGQSRGIALVFFFAGLVMVAVAVLAFLTKSYRTVSASYAQSPEPDEADADAEPEATDEAAAVTPGDDPEDTTPGPPERAQTPSRPLT